MPRSDRLPWTDKEIFTTGEAAEICRISQQTIIRCFDSGRLRGFRVPGSRFRRIPRAELIRFMKCNEIPTDILESKVRRILIVDEEVDVLNGLEMLLGADPRFDVRTTSTGYDAGLLTEQFRPHLILLGSKLPDIEGECVCGRIKTNPDLKQIKVVLIGAADDDNSSDAAARYGADEFLSRPIEVGEVLERIEQVLKL